MPEYTEQDVKRSMAVGALSFLLTALGMMIAYNA